MNGVFFSGTLVTEDCRVPRGIGFLVETAEMVVGGTMVVTSRVSGRGDVVREVVVEAVVVEAVVVDVG